MGVRVVGVSSDKAMAGPPDERALRYAETFRRLRPGQHSSCPEAIIPRSKLVLLGEIGDPKGCKLGVGLSSPSRATWPDLAFIQDGGDFGISVRVEKRVNGLDNRWSGLHCKRSSGALGSNVDVRGFQAAAFSA